MLACSTIFVALLLTPFAARAQEDVPPPPAVRVGNPVAVTAPAIAPVSVISLEFEIVEMPAVKEAETDERLIARARELQAGGKARSVTRVRLTTVDGQKGMVQFSQREPLAVGRARLGSGGAQTSYQYQNFGTLITATPQIAPNGIRVQIQVEQSRLGRSKPDPEVKDAEIGPPITTLQTTTSVTLQPGRTAIISMVTNSADGEETLRILLTTASVVK
jgi:type II secretory pathway component GspD/PulD (secretin)